MLSLTGIEDALLLYREYYESGPVNLVYGKDNILIAEEIMTLPWDDERGHRAYMLRKDIKYWTYLPGLSPEGWMLVGPAGVFLGYP